LERRRAIAKQYDEAFALISEITPLAVNKNALHAYHLCVVRIVSSVLGIDRTALFTNLREKDIAANVHYIPVHPHSFYRGKFNDRAGLCPNVEAAYEQIISIPMFPEMSDSDIEAVIEAMSTSTKEDKFKL